MRLEPGKIYRKLVQEEGKAEVLMKLSKRQVSWIWWPTGWSVWERRWHMVYCSGEHEINSRGKEALFLPTESLWLLIFPAQKSPWLGLVTDTIFSWWPHSQSMRFKWLSPGVLQGVPDDPGLANQSGICCTMAIGAGMSSWPKLELKGWVHLLLSWTRRYKAIHVLLLWLS